MFPVNGPTFLVIYLILFAAACLAYWCLRAVIVARARQRTAWLLDPIDEIAPSALTPAVVAYLLDGPGRAKGARTLARFERDAASSSGLTGDSAGSADSDDSSADALLTRHGFILSRAARASISLWAAALFGGLFAAGLTRFIIGAAHHKPVGFLLGLLLVVGWVLYTTTRHRLLRTPAGDRLVSHLRSEYQSRRGDVSYAMGFAILGWPALESNPALQVHMQNAGYSAGNNPSGVACDGICVATSGIGFTWGGGSGCSSGCSSGCGGGGCGGCS